MDIPNIPYDNLYKFFSIIGIILFLGGLIFPTYSYFYLEEKYSDNIIGKFKKEIDFEGKKKEYEFTYEEFRDKVNPLLGFLNNISDKQANIRNSTIEKVDSIRNRMKMLDTGTDVAIRVLNNSGCYNIVQDGSVYRINPRDKCIGKIMEREVQEAWALIKAIDSLRDKIKAELSTAESKIEEYKRLDLEFSKKSTELNSIMGDYEGLADFIETQLDKAKNEYITDYYYYTLYRNRVSAIRNFEGISYFLAFLGFFFAFFGFMQWYSKSQKIIDESLKTDLEIKKLQREKLRRLLERNPPP